MDEFLVFLLLVFLVFAGWRRVKRLERGLVRMRDEVGLLVLEIQGLKSEASSADEKTAPADVLPEFRRARTPDAESGPETLRPTDRGSPDPRTQAVSSLARQEAASSTRSATREAPRDALATMRPPPDPSPAAAPSEPRIAEAQMPDASKVRTLEERLGAHWTVWIGGLALALGAVLLVRYSIERGFFGPGMRIALGALLAAALATAGEFLRRKDVHDARASDEELRVETASTERNSLRAASSTDLSTTDLGSPAGPFATPYIPGVLTASGTIAAFATIYSAHAVYGFIGPAASFLALGLVALATMAAAWVHGPALAGLGLVGALATPLLVDTENASAWPVIAYDLVVVACAYGLARLKRWPWLATAAAIGAILWALPFIAQVAGSKEHEPLYAALTHIALQLGLAAYALAIVPHRGRPDQEARIDPLAHGVLGAFALLAILALGVVPPSLFGGGWIIGALLVAALLAGTAVRSASACGGAGLAGLLILAALWLWPKASGEAQDVIRLVQADAPFPFSTPPMLLDMFWRGVPAIKPLGFAAFAILAGAGVALAAIHRLREGADLPMRVAVTYAGAASLTPLVSLAIAYLRFARHEASLLLALIACLTGLGFAGATSLFLNAFRARESGALKLGLGAMAASAIAAVSLGLVFALDGGMLTVALALAALGTAFVASLLDLSALRWCVAALGVLVAARISSEPRIIGSGLSRTPIFNWLLFGYGVPASAFALAGRLLRRVRDDIPAHVADALAVLFCALLFFFEIRHATNGGDPFARGSGLVEQGLLAVTSLGFSLVLTRLDAARANIVFRYASIAFGMIGMAIAAIGLLWRYNPLFDATPLEGGPILNTLILGYLIPALIAGTLAFLARKPRPFWYWGSAAALSLILAFAFLILELRVLFHGQMIDVSLGAGVAELGLDTALLLSGALLFAFVAKGELAPWLKKTSAALALLAMAIFALGLGLLANPLLSREGIAGNAVFNTLLVGYALPSLLSAVLARRVRGMGWGRYASLASSAAILCLFAYASLEVRRVFQGTAMDLFQGFTQGELYAYSAAWLTLGILLLGYGLWHGSREARLASACFVVASVLKVFLFDLASLEGILRALSFIGLGAVLIGIGLVYQRFVFAHRAAAG
jgi:uncharacterized membrane protein